MNTTCIDSHVWRVSMVLAASLIAISPVTATVVTLDDDDVGYSEPSGAWGGEAGGNMFNGDENYSNSIGAQATYSFSGLADGRYLIYSSWVPGGNRTTAAAYAVDGMSTGTTINQQTFASHDIWREVGGGDNPSGEGYARLSNNTYKVVSGNLVIDVTNANGGFLMTDAIRLEQARDDVAAVYVIDNESPSQNDGSFSTTGSWSTFAGDTGDHRTSLHYGTATNAEATYSFTGLEPGVYRVSANWTSGGNRPTDAEYAIGNRTTQRNQQSASTGDTFEDSSFEELFKYVRVTGTTLDVDLSNAAGGAGGTALIADALRLEKFISHRGFTKLEDFEGHALNSGVDSVNDWTAFGVPGGTVVNDLANPANQAARLTGLAANEGYIVDLDGLAINDGTTGTLFFRMRSTGSINMYLADGDLGGNWWTEDEAGVYTNTNVGDGSAYRPHFDIGNTEDVTLDEWYNFWVVVDHVSDTYDLYMSQGLDGAVGGLTSVTIDSDVAFRDLTVGDLNRLFFSSNSGSVGGFVDDIYLDTLGENLLNPLAVPEPTTYGIGVLAGLGLCLTTWYQRRRATEVSI